MNLTYLEHINEIVTETRPFTGISGKLPLTGSPSFYFDNIYLLLTRYHHLQPPRRPAKEQKALCPKPADLRESVL